MTENEFILHHISDTARWSAYFRARETERPDALFRDPFARRLAGERGAMIAKATPFHEENSWSWVARTYAFDDLINQQIRQGVDMVVNLAAGLDARPYRMPLPAPLKWVEVDLPDILDYKEEILADEKPRCELRRVRLDLSEVDARRELFREIGSLARKALIISEGLLIYLTEEQAAMLAQDLAQPLSFQHWVFDIASPGLLKLLQQRTSADFRSGTAALKFAPTNGPEFFRPHGWETVEVRSMLKTAAQVRRLTLRLRFFALFPENPANMGSRPWSGACMMTKRPIGLQV